MLNLFKYELFSRWRTVLIAGIGLAAFAAIYIFIWPSVGDQFESLADIVLYQLMGVDLGSFAGFIASVVVQILPIILGVFVIFMATGTLAGEEENGTLELVVAAPLPRWQVVTMKTTALLVVILLIMIIFGAGSALELAIVSGLPDVEVDVEPMQLFVAMLGAYPLMVAIFGISLFFGAFMPSRRSAVAVMIMIYLASYVANSIGVILESLAWLKSFSLFGYLNATASVFTDGVSLGDVAVLLAVGAVFIVLTVWLFQGRNITVGQWPWQRKQRVA